jgi:hypothetical protein
MTLWLVQYNAKKAVLQELDTSYRSSAPRAPTTTTTKNPKEKGAGHPPPKLRQNRTVEQFRFLPHLNLSEYIACFLSNSPSPLTLEAINLSP